MRHEVPVPIPDAFLYLEHAGERHVVITPFEVERVQGHDGLQPHAFEQFGWDDFVKQGIPMEDVGLGTAVRAVKEFGVERAVVPTTFPVELADRLRAERFGRALWRRGRASSYYADMTRTFVVGQPYDELVKYHKLVREVLERTLAAVKPGVAGRDVYVLASERFHEEGYPTGLYKRDGE